MKPRAKGPSWVNDDALATTSKLSSASLNEPGPSSPGKGKTQHTAIENSDVAAVDDDLGEAAAEASGMVSDMDWLKQRQKAVLELPASERVFEQSDDEAQGEAQALQVSFVAQSLAVC